tara:strand:- start:27 stop:395 length:369 start_codon:yes stop_codon:yes gene_type:complete
MNITNNDLYNETKLFIKHFVFNENINYNENITTQNFNSRVAVLVDIESLCCIMRINNINVDFHIQIFNNEIGLKYRFKKEVSEIINNKDLITSNVIKSIYSCIEEINENNPIKRKILNVKNF